jgi:hypothetical protein
VFPQVEQSQPLRVGPARLVGDVVGRPRKGIDGGDVRTQRGWDET